MQSVGRLGLAVRAAPSRGAAKINVEKGGARLTVLEPASTGLPKIGKAGQWLAIKATNNKPGYVDAAIRGRTVMQRSARTALIVWAGLSLLIAAGLAGDLPAAWASTGFNCLHPAAAAHQPAGHPGVGRAGVAVGRRAAVPAAGRVDHGPATSSRLADSSSSAGPISTSSASAGATATTPTTSNPRQRCTATSRCTARISIRPCGRR